MNVFELNQRVVYPSQGVGFVKKIEQKDFKGVKTPYYTIFLDGSDMTIMVPVEKAESLGIRAIVSKEEAEKALVFLGEKFERNTSDWKLRYQQNLELLKKGTIFDIAMIVRSLFHRSREKGDLPIMERKLYDNAYKLLEDEFMNALKLEQEEVEKLLLERLEVNAPVSASKKSHDAPLDDDIDMPDEDSVDDEEDEDEDL